MVCSTQVMNSQGPLHSGAAAFLPSEARTWTAFEKMLYTLSQGRFHPGRMVGRRRRPARTSSVRISVVTPTSESRHIFHEQLWSVFDAQSWEDKELIVVDTFVNTPSRFFESKMRQDSRVVYIPLKVSVDGDHSIGLKRNMCTFLATGSYLAHFDDDDLYSSDYLAIMMRSMEQQNSSAITLGSWYIYDCATRKFGHFDSAVLGTDLQLADQWVFGYGFSFVYARELALAEPFLDESFGEDWVFYTQVRNMNLRAERKRGCTSVWVEEVDDETSVLMYRNSETGEVRWERPKDSDLVDVPERTLSFMDAAGVAVHHDRDGICLHTMHDGSTSDSWAGREVAQEEAERLQFCSLEHFHAYRDRFPWTDKVSRFINGLRPERSLTMCVT